MERIHRHFLTQKGQQTDAHVDVLLHRIAPSHRSRRLTSTVSDTARSTRLRPDEASTKKQWAQPIGFSHGLLEVAVDVLKRTKDVASKAAIRDAVAATDLDTIVGPVKFGGAGPLRNVSKTPLVGGQWVKGTKTKYELVIVDNQTMPSIPAGGKLRLLA